jgi:hypothetical protein
MISYEDLTKSIVDLIEKDCCWDRVVSVDIEADLGILDDPNKSIISISTARRVDGKVIIEKFIAENESDKEEAKIFREFGKFCLKVKPLVLVGYGIGRFDNLVIGLKMRALDGLFKSNGRYDSWYWALRESMNRSYVLDTIDPVRFEIGKHDNAPPSILSLEKAISHPRFGKLQFKNTKNIVSDLQTKGNKWDIIRHLWKNDRNKFEQYIEGDVHDTLLIAEDIFNMNSKGVKKNGDK